MINKADELLTGSVKKTKGFLSDFKKFISQGNIIDMAVGVVIGTAFKQIISSLVADIIMPAVGMLIGNSDIADLKYELVPAVLDGETVVTPAVAIRYGLFFQYIIDFLIIALCMYIVVKFAMGFRKKIDLLAFNKKEQAKQAEAEAAKEPEVKEPSENEKMLSTLVEIRDLLKKDNTK